MSKTLSFNNLFSLGNVIKENELMVHHHFADFLSLYDGNYITFKEEPSLEEFIQIEEYLTAFHLSKKQNHLKFKFPNKFIFSEEFTTYLDNAKYTIDTLELFVLDKSLFPTVTNTHSIKVKVVEQSDLTNLLDFKFQVNMANGEDYALRNKLLIEELFNTQKMSYLIAYDNGIPAGCLNLIKTSQTLEIDDLYVHEEFRHKKIASLLQQKAIELAKERQVFLLADGNDTPRNMYLNQGYTIVQARYEIFKSLCDERSLSHVN